MKYFNQLYQWEMPGYVGVESTNRCNLSCSHCHQSHFKLLHGELDPDLFFGLMGELDPSTTVSLSSMGEPLVAKNFRLFFDYLLGNGYHATFTTNGLLLAGHLESMIGRDVSITLSMDGASEDVYKSIRGVSNKKVIENIEHLQLLKKKAGEDKPALSITMILSRRNIEDLPNMVLLAARLGACQLVAYHQYFYINSPLNEFGEQSLFFHQELSDRMHAEAIRLAREQNITFSHTPLFGEGIPREEQNLLSSYISGDRKNCRWFEKHALIGWHGVVFGCCSFDRMFMGSLRYNSFRDIWNGPLYREMRLKFINGRPPAVCYSDCIAMQTIDTSRDAFFKVNADESSLQTTDLVGPLSYSFRQMNTEYMKAVEAYESGDDDISLESLLRMLKADGNFFEVHHLIALIHRRKGNEVLAGDHFRKAADICRNYEAMM